jgi:hypothetical protein
MIHIRNKTQSKHIRIAIEPPTQPNRTEKLTFFRFPVQMMQRELMILSSSMVLCHQ